MKLIKSFVPHSRCFGSYFDVIFLMYLVSSGFSFKPTSSCSSSSSSNRFSQEWARRKVVVKLSIKSKLEGGVPLQNPKKKLNKEDFRRNLVTHGSQIYWIELQFCCLLNSQVGIIQVRMFLSTSRSYQFTSFTLPISTCTRCQVYT